MKGSFFAILTIFIICLLVPNEDRQFTGSTPVGAPVREFMGIASTDTIDFMRWQLRIGASSFELDCRYGIGKPNTPGFIKENKVSFSGSVTHNGHYLLLHYKDRQLNLLEVNNNILYLLDSKYRMLLGTGGFSYALNNLQPVKSSSFNIRPDHNRNPALLVFHGRTPCAGLEMTMHDESRTGCLRLKWYLLLYSDSVTGLPTIYRKGYRSSKNEDMEEGKWEIINGRNGNITYKLTAANKSYSLYLLKGDEQELFFTDAEGNLLVGNKDFSYVLNRSYEQRK